MSDTAWRSVTRRALMKSVGFGLFGTGVAAGSEESSTAARRVVGTESTYGTEFVVQQSSAIEKTVELGELGTAIVGEFDPETASTLARGSSVKYVERDIRITFPESVETYAAAPADGQQMPWGCERIGATALHEQASGQGGVDVAIIDSGIDSDHPDLRANLGDGYAAADCGGDACRRPWDDDHTHGTHCAGIVGAIDNAHGVLGVSPDVTLHAVKVMTAAGTGSASDIAEGIVWAADRGCDVANVSLGAEEPSSVLHDAVKYARRNGMLVVAAAGNKGCSDCLHYPGAFPETVCVGATDQGDGLADFSSTGAAIDVVAPGTEIPSTVLGGDYRAFSGTSMATPHVVGAAAILIGAGYTAEEAAERLRSTAEDVGLETDEGGAGLVDCVAAFGDGPGPSAGVATGWVHEVGETSATVGGRLTELSAVDEVTVGVEYWPAAEGPEAASRVTAGTRSSTGQYETKLSELARETAYRYRAFCSGAVEATGSIREFTTGEEPPAVTVETTGASDVEPTRATVTGELTGLGGRDSVAVGVEYWVEGDRDATLARTELRERTETGAFERSLDGLDPETTYLARAVAEPESGGTVHGDTVMFTTGDGLAVVATGATDTGPYGATLGGEVTSLGGADSVTVGVRYWERDDDRAEGTSVDAGNLRRADMFEESVIDLQSGTTYRYVATARTGDSPAVSSEPVDFETGGGW